MIKDEIRSLCELSKNVRVVVSFYHRGPCSIDSTYTQFVPVIQDGEINFPRKKTLKSGEKKMCVCIKIKDKQRASRSARRQLASPIQKGVFHGEKI